MTTDRWMRSVLVSGGVAGVRPTPVSADIQADRSAGGRGPLMARLGLCQEFLPGPHVRATAQERAALALGHASPHAELDVVVEGVGEALGPHHAAEAPGLHPVLRGSLDEQLVRVEVTTGGVGRPVAVDGRADETGVAVTAWRADGLGQASGHATCLSCRDRVRGPVRVVTWR